MPPTGNRAELRRSELHVGSSSTDYPPTCKGTRHGTVVAYVENNCRCDTAVWAHYRYDKQLKADLRAGRRRLIDVTGSRRRLQALCAIGYSQPDLAARLNCTQHQVWQYLAGPRPTIHRDTAARIAKLYTSLADHPSTGPRTGRTISTARHHGWLPPLWWDDDTIDDPSATPGPRTSSPTTSSTAVDPVVVERLIDGQPPLHVTRAERAEAVRVLAARDWTHSLIAQQLAMSGTRVKQILDATVTAATHTSADNDRQEASA